jgi:hypothetical protein
MCRPLRGLGVREGEVRRETGDEFVRRAEIVGACRQHYAVLGQLNNGLFNATLTHYGAYYGGSCHVFSASVSGYASLNV